MNKKKKFVLKDDEKIENEAISKKDPTFTTVAFSIVQLQGVWVVVEIPIDPETRETGEWKIHPEDGSKMSALEKFKISAADKLM